MCKDDDYHRDSGHNIDNCETIKFFIEKLTIDGYKEFIANHHY